MACFTQEEIGEREGVSQKTVDNVLVEMAELPKLLKASADHLTDFDPPIYNVWKQQTKTAGAGEGVSVSPLCETELQGGFKCTH